MNAISESELRDCIKNDAVSGLTITSRRGVFQVAANLTWKEGDWQLTTSRKTIRTWTSLDRLVRHFRKTFTSPESIKLTLILEPKPETPKPETELDPQ